VDPQYLVPGEIYEVEVMLWNTSYIVAPVSGYVELDVVNFIKISPYTTSS
jgi:hypothetical protein